MNTIEQAAKRLEQLRRAGIDVSGTDTSPTPAASPAPAEPSPPQRIDFPPAETGIPLSAIPAVGAAAAAATPARIATRSQPGIDDRRPGCRVRA